jgi:hypothetical protein
VRSRCIVVLGVLGRLPFAGVAWQVLHYLEALRRLGHDVYYVEDTGDWPYDPVQNTITEDPSYTVAYIARTLSAYGLGDRWAYRSSTQDRRWWGLSDLAVSDLFARADALVNLTGATVLRDEHRVVPVRIYLETDPVLPEIRVAQGDQFMIDLLSAHTHHFTFGENIGSRGCLVPLGRFKYIPARQPIVLEWWRPPRDCGAAARLHGAFTTVGSWRQTGKDVEWNGERYAWSKHHEFLKVIDLPRRTDTPLELALAWKEGVDDEAIELLKAHGWLVRPALPISLELDPYRDYLLGSRGEFTVAKDQNVRLRSGWFSDRSACYLAAGKPVITQDTGFGDVLPTGRGLFAFRTMEDVLRALEAIGEDYAGHSRASHEVAAEWFAAERVVASLLRGADL